MIRKWRKMVWKYFLKWYHTHGCNHPDHKVVWKSGRESIYKAADCSWWEYDKVYTILFWRCPDYYQDIAREGLVSMFDSLPPKSMEHQPSYANKNIRNKVKEKLQWVLDQGYFNLTDIQFIELLMYMFYVKKVKMIYKWFMMEQNWV